MPNTCTKFLRGQDQLGSSVVFNYKQAGSYGTILGGCLSLTIYLITFLFISTQLYALLFSPGFN